MLKMLAAAILLSPALLAGSTAAEHVIGQKNKAFAKAEITVKVGEKVVFKNDDDVTHNVFSTTEGFRFNLKTQAPGTSSTQVFDHEGKAEIRCAFHPTMKMTVQVKK